MNKTRMVSRVTAFFVSFAVYLPVLAGIISVMWYVIPLWYTSWYIVQFIFPFFYWDGHWNPLYDWTTDNRSLVFPIWGAAEFLVFVIGVMLILYGLKVILVHRTKGDVLVTTGPYRWIRHPQHLGIIMSLLAPALSFSYIRPSDIVSWSLIAFGLIVSADLEEVSLSKRFGEKYDEYRSKVSFMIPYCLPLPAVMKSGVLGQGRPARYVLWFVIYWLIMTFILFLFSFVRIDHWL